MLVDVVVVVVVAVVGAAAGAAAAGAGVWANAAVVPIARPRASAICVIFILDSFVDESVHRTGIRPAHGQPAPGHPMKGMVAG